jgi:hypothetical protein
MRYELSDYEWTAIKPMLPNKPRGVRRVNDRCVLVADLRARVSTVSFASLGDTSNVTLHRNVGTTVFIACRIRCGLGVFRSRVRNDTAIFPAGRSHLLWLCRWADFELYLYLRLSPVWNQGKIARLQ